MSDTIYKVMKAIAAECCADGANMILTMTFPDFLSLPCPASCHYIQKTLLTCNSLVMQDG